MTNQEIGRSLASSFVEMAAALDKLPQVEADLAAAKADNDSLNERIKSLEQINNSLGEKITTLEASLDDSTKSHNSASNARSLLLEEVRKVIGQLAVVTDIVDPQPVPTVSSSDTDTNASMNACLTGVETTSTASSSDKPATSSEAPSSPFVPPTSELGTVHSSDGSQAPSTPTSGSDESPESPTPPTVTRPYWLKPSNQSWREWRANHGDVPHWVTDDMMDIAS
jgi:hypothetical protein